MKRNQGFTLIEILITIGMIALLSSLFLAKSGRWSRHNEETFKRELSSTFRECYEEAILRKKVYRVVFDLDSKPQTYWVEVGPDEIELTKEAKKVEEKKKKKDKDNDKEFVLAKAITKKKREVTSTLTIDGIKTTLGKEDIKEGIVYTHFFPHGFAEKTIVYLKDKNENISSLVLMPISGKSRLYERKYEDK